MPDTGDVAKWMLEEFERRQMLYQDEAAWSIQKTFGKEFVYQNENGNLAISKKVLAEFRELTEKSAVWDRSQRAWRPRHASDGPGRQVDA